MNEIHDNSTEQYEEMVFLSEDAKTQFNEMDEQEFDMATAFLAESLQMTYRDIQNNKTYF